jgi:hypothetical protein
MKAHAQGLVRCMWNNDRAIFSKKGHVQVLKSRNKELSFFTRGNTFERSCRKADYKRWIVRK